MRFVIWTPPYAERSAGIAALHRLCHWLTILGHDAGVTTHVLNPDWETKGWNSQITDDLIAVYPEIVAGNPLGAPRVARWALSHPGFHYFGSPAVFDPCDAVFAYAERFRPATEAAAGGKPVQRLFVSVYPNDMFFPGLYPKMHDMYYVGRGQNVYDAFASRVDLSRAVQFPGGYPNRYEVGKALRRVDRFFCFDQVCALLLESMMCGARGVQLYEDTRIVEVERDSVETMNAFEDGNRFDQPGDVEALVRAFA
jgi:hypothetical protein